MKLVFEQLVPVSVEQLFDFHRRPASLVLLQRGWPAFRMLAHAPELAEGARIEVEERFGPCWLRLSLVHARVDPPRSFLDRQVAGPFARLEHLHEFLARPGGTLLRDTLDFRLRWSLGGPLADRLVAAPRFRRWFAYRHRALLELVREGALGPERRGS